MTTTRVSDRVLDRLPSKPDPVRMAQFPIIDVILGLFPRSYTWACDLWLDQGTEGACVPHGWTHELAARPVVVPFPRTPPGGTQAVDAQRFAFEFYDWCRRNDEWPGENYDGTSVAAGARGVKMLGLVPEYRWSRRADEVAIAVSRKGPVVIGVDWWTGMFAPDSRGQLNLTGQVEGGHCLLIRGYNRLTHMFRLRNSWGRDWGNDGDALLHQDDLDQLLREGGEACLPLRRTQ